MQALGHLFYGTNSNRTRLFIGWGMLQDFAVPQMPEQTILQQDGAPALYHNDVRDFINGHFPGSRTGKRGSIV